MSNGVPDGALHVASRRIEGGPTLAVREPWSGAELGRVVMADPAHAEEATAASVRAFARMRARTSYERKTALARVAQEIEARQDVFAELIARAAGKPIALARAAGGRAVSTFEIGSAGATRVRGEAMSLDIPATPAGYSETSGRVPARTV